MRLESRGIDYQRRAGSRRAAWAALVWFAAWIAFALVGSWPAFMSSGLTVWFYVGSAAAALFGAVSLVRLRFYPALTAPTAARRPAKLSVEEGALVIDHGNGVWRWAISDVVEGWTESFQDEDDVVLRTRRDDLLAVRIDSPEEGSAFLRAVGVSADKQVVRLRLAEASASSATVGCIALVGGIVLPFALVGSAVGLWLTRAATLQGAPDRGLWVSAAIFVASLLAAFKVLQTMVPPLATVGVDGIEVRGFGSRRFIPLDDISGAESTERGVALQLRSGPALTLTTFRNTADGRQGHPATRAALLHRIEEALAARHASQSQVARATALERHGKTFARWRVDLASLTKQDADYRRSAGLGRDDLERVLEDASAPVEHRVGAAVALAAAGDVDVRRRVRIAAAACADQSLRAALEAAAEQDLDEDKLERALRRVQES